MPEELAELIAERFAALGEPTRIRLVDARRERVCGGLRRQTRDFTALLERPVSARSTIEEARR